MFAALEVNKGLLYKLINDDGFGMMFGELININGL